MKVLIVSFDKALTEELKKALSDHEVYTAKNSEEALKVVPSDMEGVIYDAISGAISEEDINTLYQKRFSNARFIILYDELFPVEESNIIVPQKLLVPRETDPKEIAKKLIEFPVPGPAEEESQELEIEHTHLVEEEPTQAEEEPPAQEVVQEPTPVEESKETPEPAPQEGEAPFRKVLIVSFDQPLIDTVKLALGQSAEIETVKTVKQAMEKGKDADLIVFDAISGAIAEKGLIEMSTDPDLAPKPYLILVDDLFPINVENIPLENKVSISRDVDAQKIKEALSQLRPVAPAVEETAPQETVPEPAPAEEAETSQEPTLEEVTTEEAPAEETPPITEEKTEEAPEIEIEQTQLQETVETPQEEEEEIPALSALEEILEEKFKDELPPKEEEAEETAEVQEQTATVSQAQPEREIVEPPRIEELISKEDIEGVLEKVVSGLVSEEKIKEAVVKTVESYMTEISGNLQEIVQREIEKVFESVDVKGIVKEVARDILKRKLDELIT